MSTQKLEQKNYSITIVTFITAKKWKQSKPMNGQTNVYLSIQWNIT